MFLLSFTVMHCSEGSDLPDLLTAQPNKELSLRYIRNIVIMGNPENLKKLPTEDALARQTELFEKGIQLVETLSDEQLLDLLTIKFENYSTSSMNKYLHVECDRYSFSSDYCDLFKKKGDASQELNTRWKAYSQRQLQSKNFLLRDYLGMKYFPFVPDDTLYKPSDVQVDKLVNLIEIFTEYYSMTEFLEKK